MKRDVGEKKEKEVRHTQYTDSGIKTCSLLCLDIDAHFLPNIRMKHRYQTQGQI